MSKEIENDNSYMHVLVYDKAHTTIRYDTCNVCAKRFFERPKFSVDVCVTIYMYSRKIRMQHELHDVGIIQFVILQSSFSS